MIPVRNFASKIRMQVDYHGCQLAWCEAPAYLIKESAFPNPLACRHSFLYKTIFCDELKGELDMHSVHDLVVLCLGNVMGQVGRYIGVFDWVHGGYGIGLRNLEGRMLLKFCLLKELCKMHSIKEREEARWHSDLEKMRLKLTFVDS